MARSNARAPRKHVLVTLSPLVARSELSNGDLPTLSAIRLHDWSTVRFQSQTPGISHRVPTVSSRVIIKQTNKILTNVCLFA